MSGLKNFMHQNFMHHPRVVIILLKQVYASLHFIPILLESYCFIFLCSVCFLSAQCFEFDVIYLDLKLTLMHTTICLI